MDPLQFNQILLVLPKFFTFFPLMFGFPSYVLPLMRKTGHRPTIVCKLQLRSLGR